MSALQKPAKNPNLRTGLLWRDRADGKLEQAAMELYAERGYDQTTVAEITQRAGLTERTFFRYSADEREVLFGGSEGPRDRLVSEVASAPAEASPLEAAAAGLVAAGALIQERRGRQGARAAGYPRAEPRAAGAGADQDGVLGDRRRRQPAPAA